jgi:hypothetical protein
VLAGGALHAVLAVMLCTIAKRATPAARDRGAGAA